MPSAVLTVRVISLSAAPTKAASFARAVSAACRVRVYHSMGGTCSS